MEQEIKAIQKQLVKIYYLIYAILIILLIGGALLFPRLGGVSPSVAVILNTVTILTVLAVPLALKLFSVKTKRIQASGDEFEKKALGYIKWSKIQMFLLGIPGVFASISYAFLEDRTSLFCFLIAFMVLMFTKPSLIKIDIFFQKEE